MLYFENDYCEGAHEEILKKLVETNLEKTSGYGTDPYCASAREKIRRLAAARRRMCSLFRAGHRPTSSLLRRCCAGTKGSWRLLPAISTAMRQAPWNIQGIKYWRCRRRMENFRAADLREYLETYYADANHEHMTFPGMVYISYPTEYGTLYTKAELEALHQICAQYQIPLFMDGARLGYGLASPACDLTLSDLAQLTDVFYIGGTKVGALCGEAVVFPHGAPAHFMTMVKQQGGLLAKGRLLGLQFDVLFTDDLYMKISRNAIAAAETLKAALREKGYRFFLDSPTNQIFVVLENAQLQALEGKAKFGFWEKFDDTHTVVRIATSWATRMEEIQQLIELL